MKSYSFKSNLMIMIGIPGSGKSTLAKELADGDNSWCVLSSDDIREELYGDASVQKDHAKVFSTLYERARLGLVLGKNIIIDSCSVTSWARAQALRECEEYANGIFAVVCDPSLEECIERNSKRERVVPEDVVKRMYAQLRNEYPILSEGFDVVMTDDCLRKLMD